MKSILPSLLTVSLLLSAAMAGETRLSTGAVAKDVPLGHKDFYPSPQRPVGFRGDGNGAHPDARSVSEWSESKNLLWKTPVPNYGNSSPLVVGDKVFVVSEAGWQSDCPTLACYDLATGKQLWVSDVDQFNELPEAERADARARGRVTFTVPGLRLYTTCVLRPAAAGA